KLFFCLFGLAVAITLSWSRRYDLWAARTTLREPQLAAGSVTSARASSQRTSFTMEWGHGLGTGFGAGNTGKSYTVNIILIGAQGSGKGTQAELLATHLQLKPCASGELLRAAIAAETPAGVAARPYYDRGDLVPDRLVIDMILDAIHDLGAARGIILDGFPR